MTSLPVLEMHLLQVAGHAGPHLDDIDGDEAADIFVLVDDGALGRLGDRHGRRRRRGLLGAASPQPARPERDDSSNAEDEPGPDIGTDAGQASVIDAMSDIAKLGACAACEVAGL